MDHSVSSVKKAFGNRFGSYLPRGELWIGTDVLKKADLEDNLKGHFTLAKRLKQDILSLPVSEDMSINKSTGYRYFSHQELKEASRINDLFLAALIDGPLQRLVHKKGLMKILSEWRQEGHGIAKEYGKERAAVDVLIKRCLELPVDAIIIADDLAGERSPLIDPHDIQALFSPFYIQAISGIHAGYSYAFFHSCGNITRLIPQFISYGFDGLAAIEHRANDLRSLREKYGSSLTLMGGIDVDILEPEEIPSSTLEEYESLLRYFSLGGGFILCSSSGLYSGNFLERIQELYRIADRLSNR